MPGAGLEFSISPDRNLARYLQHIRRFPMLAANEEYDWRSGGQTTATSRPRTSWSPVTCDLSRKSPWDIAVTVYPWAS